MLRIIGGERRGQRFGVPGTARPTTDRVREAIFNILGQRLDGERVLDLFAGSGALGLEALSRGASHATFVESSARHAAMIRANAAKLGYQARANVVVVRVEALVEKPPAATYHTALADPPLRRAARSATLGGSGDLLARSRRSSRRRALGATQRRAAGRRQDRDPSVRRFGRDLARPGGHRWRGWLTPWCRCQVGCENVRCGHPATRPPGHRRHATCARQREMIRDRESCSALRDLPGKL